MEIGFLGALTLLFVGPKLGGAIVWSWLWVLSPLWIGISTAFLVLFAFLMWRA